MESLLSTSECGKSTKNSFQASHSGPPGAAKKQKKITRTSALTGRPRARTPSSLTSAAVFSITGAHPALRFFPPPLAVFKETWQPVLPVYISQNKPKKPTWCTNHGLQSCMQHVQPSLIRLMSCCMQHTPACITCMHSRSTQITEYGGFYCRFEFARKPPPLCHS